MSASPLALNRDAIAERLARDIPEGWYVNLGIGMPTKVADFVPPDREVLFHSENGVLGLGPAPQPGSEDPWLINAGKQFVTLRDGGSYFHQAESFGLIRGGHLDLCVLGAFEVADNGDFANWSTNQPNVAPGVGGAMDLAVGARRIWIIMDHTTKAGEPRLVKHCRYPLTARGVVSRVYTNLAVIDVTPDGFCLIDSPAGLSFAEIQAVTDAPLLK